jgi:hypothetical protein
MADLIELTDLPSAYQSRADIARIITAVSALAEGYCRRPLSIQAGRVEYHDGGSWCELFLQATPIISIDSIYVDGLAITDYVVDNETGRVRRGTGHGSPNFAPWFPSGANNIVVTYTGGYLTIPEDIKQAVVTGVVNTCRDADRDPFLQSESFAGQYSWTRGDANVVPGGRYACFGRTGLALLAPYRRSGKHVVG